MIADDTVIFNSVYLYTPTITAASRCLNMKKKKFSQNSMKSREKHSHYFHKVGVTVRCC